MSRLVKVLVNVVNGLLRGDTHLSWGCDYRTGARHRYIYSTSIKAVSCKELCTSIIILVKHLYIHFRERACSHFSTLKIRAWRLEMLTQMLGLCATL